MGAPSEQRPGTPAEMVRAAADWLDTYDEMARTFFVLLERSEGSMPEDLRQRAKALIPAVTSDEVQQDLRALATRLADGEVPSAPSPSDELVERLRSDGHLLSAIDAALNTVYMERQRGERVSDQAETVRVHRAVLAVVAAALDAGGAS